MTETIPSLITSIQVLGASANLEDNQDFIVIVADKPEAKLQTVGYKDVDRNSDSIQLAAERGAIEFGADQPCIVISNNIVDSQTRNDRKWLETIEYILKLNILIPVNKDTYDETLLSPISTFNDKDEMSTNWQLEDIPEVFLFNFPENSRLNDYFTIDW